ncbi:MAG: hypothetical protein RL113_683 [Pseudomonadota bacterium]
MKVALTGASGFVGTKLQTHFDDVVIIERNESVTQIVEKLRDVEVVVNLAGAPIIKRWNEAYKSILMQSRIESTKRVVEAIHQTQVKHFISTSAIGIYPSDRRCDEGCTQIADDFLGDLAQRWEAEALRCNKPTTILRFGVILGKEGGALAKMLPPFQWGVGGVIGDGKMMTSWIDIDDLVGIYDFVIQKKITGIINAVSPYPVNNQTFTKALGNVLHRPTIFPLPTLILRLIYGEASSVLTDSKEVYPRRLTEEGFVFDYPTIESSLLHQLTR